MLQPPAGNVRFFPATKITHNFNIDLIKSFFIVFFSFLFTKLEKFRDYIDGHG